MDVYTISSSETSDPQPYILEEVNPQLHLHENIENLEEEEM